MKNLNEQTKKDKLFEKLSHWDDDVVQEAIIELGNIHCSEAVHILIYFLKNDENCSTRYHSAESLGKINDARALMQLIISSREDRSIAVRGMSALSLGKDYFQKHNFANEFKEEVKEIRKIY